MNYWRKLSFKKKITLGFGILIFIILTMVCFSYFEFRELRLLQDIGAERSADAVYIASVAGNGEKLYRIIADAQINRDLEQTNQVWTEAKAKAMDDISKLDDIVDTAEEKELLKQAKKHMALIVSLFEKEMLPLLKSTKGISQKVKDLDGKIDSEVDQFSKPLEDIKDELKEEQIEADKTFDGTVNSIITVFIILAIIGIAVAVAIAILIIRELSISMDKIIKSVEKVAKGDLTSEFAMGEPVNCSDIKQCGKKECPAFGKEAHCWLVAGSFSNRPTCPKAKKGIDCRLCNLYKKHGGNEFDEMGAALNGMVQEFTEKAKIAESIANHDLTKDVLVASEKDVLGKALKKMVDELKKMIYQIQNSSNQVTNGSVEISDASQALSQGATEQAASLEEISSSMAEISSQVKASAENASEANKLSQHTRTAAAEGGDNIKKMVGAMEDINQSSQEISKIIKTIDGIAFQTNILALNAAVEAARAGVHGKGFAVVADEVRTLAGRSATAAAETAELISASTQNVQAGQDIAARSSESFDNINQNIIKVADFVSEIAASSSEQAQGVAQVDIGLEQIDKVTQQNTASAEETASSAEELTSQAKYLQDLVSQFNL